MILQGERWVLPTKPVWILLLFLVGLFGLGAQVCLDLSHPDNLLKPFPMVLTDASRFCFTTRKGVVGLWNDLLASFVDHIISNLHSQ
jgi:hypothetical protein